MTRYAFDEARPALVASWSTGRGDTAVTVAGLTGPLNADDLLHVAQAATGLSAALWRCYTHPASAAGSLEEDSPGWHRQLSRDAFDLVTDAVRDPHLPRNGTIIHSYVPVEEHAHRLGRALHVIGDGTLTGQVIADVEAELAAVEQAERGDLNGRGRQAVVLTREDASPVQVAAADRVLHDYLLDRDQLFTDFDPAAAAVAAAHWLWAAASVAGEAAGLEITDVVRTADGIEALPWQTPTIVLGLLAQGGDESPRSAVLGLISDAMLVAEGSIPDLLSLLSLVADARAAAGEDADLDELLDADIRPTPLDPARPAPDLLEDLVSGIHACWLIFQRGSNGSEHGDEEAVSGEFIRRVRAAAAGQRDWLL